MATGRDVLGLLRSSWTKLIVASGIVLFISSSSPALAESRSSGAMVVGISGETGAVDIRPSRANKPRRSRVTIQDTGYIPVVKDVKLNETVRIYAWVTLDFWSCDVQSLGSWTVVVPPIYGKFTSSIGLNYAPIAGCPTNTVKINYGYYTWTKENPPQQQDKFKVQWSDGQGNVRVHDVTINYVAPPEPDPKLAIKRPSLDTLKATGSPEGGSFTIHANKVAGLKPIKFSDIKNKNTNPQNILITAPKNTDPKGLPQQGSLTEATVTYSTKSKTDSKTIRAAAFGLSCYYTPLEVEFGYPPSEANCKNTPIRGKVYKGVYTDPRGLKGQYCAGFIETVLFNGSGRTYDRRLFKAAWIPDPNDKKKQIRVINSLGRGAINYGADHTEIKEDQTVARDRSVIPKPKTPEESVTLNLDGIQGTRRPEDTGGYITGYRIDLYKGEGNKCRNFPNNIVLGACSKRLNACPSQQDVKE